MKPLSERMRLVLDRMVMLSDIHGPVLEGNGSPYGLIPEYFAWPKGTVNGLAERGLVRVSGDQRSDWKGWSAEVTQEGRDAILGPHPGWEPGDPVRVSVTADWERRFVTPVTLLRMECEGLKAVVADHLRELRPPGHGMGRVYAHQGEHWECRRVDVRSALDVARRLYWAG